MAGEHVAAAGGADAAGGLGFPDAPRLELDELLVRLMPRQPGHLDQGVPRPPGVLSGQRASLTVQ